MSFVRLDSGEFPPLASGGKQTSHIFLDQSTGINLLQKRDKQPKLLATKQHHTQQPQQHD